MSESEVKLADPQVDGLEREREKIRRDVADEQRTLRKWKTMVALSKTGH
jgi:hypothetical protein